MKLSVESEIIYQSNTGEVSISEALIEVKAKQPTSCSDLPYLFFGELMMVHLTILVDNIYENAG